MYDGQYLHGKDDIWGPWIPRGGDIVRVTLDVIDLSSGNIKGIHIIPYTKSEETPGDGSPISGAVRIKGLSVGRFEKEWSGISELFRVRIIGDQDASQFTLSRLLPMIWFDAVATA